MKHELIPSSVVLDYFFSVLSILGSSCESRFCSESYFSKECILRILSFPSISNSFISSVSLKGVIF